MGYDSLVDAKIEGLARLMEARLSSNQRRLDALDGVPVELATLKTLLAALDEREHEMDVDIDRRLDALEQAGASAVSHRWSVVAAVVGAVVASLPGLLVLLHIA